MKRNAPFRLVFSTVSQSSSLIRISKPSRVTPALLTRISTRRSARIFSAAAFTACGVGDIHGVGPGLAAKRADFGGDFLRVLRRARDANDVRALGGEFQRDGAADAPAGAGDDGDLDWLVGS